MTLRAFMEKADYMPPPWLRKLEVIVLMRVFARALDGDAPCLRILSADAALAVYRELTASSLEHACSDVAQTSACRKRLAAEAYALGSKLRHITFVKRADAFDLARFLYRGIAIELSGSVPGDLRFGPCSFAQRYTAHDCWVMSAFDQGFLCGLAALDGHLVFECRLTEGASCCMAHIE